MSGGVRDIHGRVVLRPGLAGVPGPPGPLGRGENVSEVLQVQRQRQRGGGGDRLDQLALRQSPGRASNVGLLETGHDQSAAHRHRVPDGHAVQWHQRDTHEHGGHIPAQWQHIARRDLHHVGRSGTGDRVTDRSGHRQQGRTQVLPDRHVRPDRLGAGHHRRMFLCQQVGQ